MRLVLEDGLQNEKKIVPTWLKLKLINNLIEAGLKQIQITAFVHPDRVPQMADAEHLVESLPKRSDIVYNALVLNKKGLSRALSVEIPSIEISISASDTHSRINSGLSRERALKDALEMIALAKQGGRHVRAGIQCAFGCAYEGKLLKNDVLGIAKQYINEGIDMLAIADTTAMATPQTTTALLNDLVPLCNDVPIVLHLHDKNGSGYANMDSALMSGIVYFDTSIAGLGGCPFVPNALGNIDTVEAASIFGNRGLETGLDIAILQQCKAQLISFFKK